MSSDQHNPYDPSYGGPQDGPHGGAEGGPHDGTGPHHGAGSYDAGVAQTWQGQTWDTHYQPAVRDEPPRAVEETAYLPPVTGRSGHPVPPGTPPGAPPGAPAGGHAPGYDAPTAYLPPVTGHGPGHDAPTAYLPPVTDQGPGPAGPPSYGGAATGHHGYGPGPATGQGAYGPGQAGGTAAQAHAYGQTPAPGAYGGAPEHPGHAASGTYAQAPDHATPAPHGQAAHAQAPYGQAPYAQAPHGQTPGTPGPPYAQAHAAQGTPYAPAAHPPDAAHAPATPQPSPEAPASPADPPAHEPEYSAPTTLGNTRITDAQRARAEGRSPIIDPGIQPAGLTALLGVLLAGGAALGPYALLVPLVLLQAVTAAGWFRLNGMWPARQGIALAFLGGAVADAALLAAGREHAPAALLGTLGVWVLLVLVLQLRSHAAPEERMYGLMATVVSSALAVVAAGFLAAEPDAVVAGALGAAAATIVRALPLPGPVSPVGALLAGAGAGAVAGAVTGLGVTGAVLGLAAGVCAVIGLRVAAYDYPSRFVHMTAGVALPLAVAAPVVYVLGRALV
ncbi:hypothetical protein [Streptomyces fradiae]